MLRCSIVSTNWYNTMTPLKLFIHRMFANVKFQLRAISIVVDWIVAIYIVVPALFIGGVIYTQMWSEMPSWIALIPVQLVMGIIYFAACTGAYRYFIQAGDQLFIICNQAWIQAQIRYGFMYSLFMKVIQTTIILALTAPLLVKQFQISVSSMISLLLFSAVYGLVVAFANERIAFKFDGIKQYMMQIILYGVGYYIYLNGAQLIVEYVLVGYVLTLLVILLLLLLSYLRLGWKGTYLFDIEREYKARTKLLSLIMKDEAAFKVPSRRKRPLLFPRSQRLFRKLTPSNGVAEFMIKGFFRSGSQMLSYVQLISTAIVGLWLAPAVSKWILWAFVAFVLVTWAKMKNRHTLTEDIMMLFRIEGSAQIQAVTIASFWMALPAVGLLSIWLGLLMYGWIGIPIMMIISPLVCKLVSSTLSSF